MQVRQRKTSIQESVKTTKQLSLMTTVGKGEADYFKHIHCSQKKLIS
jgi:hypothetical protein